MGSIWVSLPPSDEAQGTDPAAVAHSAPPHILLGNPTSAVIPCHSSTGRDGVTGSSTHGHTSSGCEWLQLFSAATHGGGAVMDYGSRTRGTLTRLSGRRASVVLGAVAGGAAFAVWLGNGLVSPPTAEALAGTPPSSTAELGAQSAATMSGATMPGMDMAGTADATVRTDATCPAPVSSPPLPHFS